MKNQRRLWGLLVQMEPRAGGAAMRSPGVDSGWCSSSSTSSSASTRSLGSLAGGQTGTRTGGWSQQRAWEWGVPVAAVMALSLSIPAASCEALESKTAPGMPKPVPGKMYMLGLQTRQRIFFKYEKRVRDFSPLDKVFEYFASQERKNIKYMLPHDMLHALVVTYPSSHSGSDRAGCLDGERVPECNVEVSTEKMLSSMFQLFDVDGDGLISYYEFLLLVTLLSIPKRDIQTIFKMMDTDGNGDISADEFRIVTSMLQSLAVSAGMQKQSSATRNRKLGASAEEADSGLMTSFFGKDKNGKLKLSRFTKFLEDLHEELVQMEFRHYADPSSKGKPWISGVDFARSLVVTADIKNVESLLSRVDQLEPALAMGKISYEEFRSVHILLHSNLHDLEVACEFMQQVGRKIGCAEFGAIVKTVTGVKLSDQVEKLIMATFGDPAGNLDIRMFLECMHRRGVLKGRSTSGHP